MTRRRGLPCGDRSKPRVPGGPPCAATSSPFPPGSPPPHDVWSCTCPRLAVAARLAGPVGHRHPPLTTTAEQAPRNDPTWKEPDRQSNPPRPPPNRLRDDSQNRYPIPPRNTFGGSGLSALTGGQQFAYVFDLGDDWAHLCTVGPERIEPLDTLGTTPDRPMPYWGWGSIPDRYGRRWDGDDGETPPPLDPELADLPALQPGWGPRHR